MMTKEQSTKTNALLFAITEFLVVDYVYETSAIDGWIDQSIRYQVSFFFFLFPSCFATTREDHDNTNNLVNAVVARTNEEGWRLHVSMDLWTIVIGLVD